MNREENTIGLVGAGLLGSAIANRLLAAGFDVRVLDRDAARVAEAVAAGAQPVDSYADLAGQSMRIVLSLPTSETVADVLESADGIAVNVRPNTIIIDTTTGDPDATVALAKRLSERSIIYLDATVAGSSAQLREGDVTLIVGGDHDAFDACADVFAAFSDRVFHTGPAGTGSRTKLLVNQVLGLNRLALAETLALAKTLGVDPEDLLEILKATPAYSRVMDTKGPKMIAGDFAPQARLAQHRKDVGLILELARRVGLQLPVSSLHAQLLDEAVNNGLGELDNAAIIRVMEKKSRS